MATIYTTGRANFRGGSQNSGSHLIGWDNGLVRSERYTFSTGQWPVSAISFAYPVTGVSQGSEIAIRCAISTSPTANVNKSGATGTLVGKTGSTRINVSLAPNTTYYIVFYPGVDKNKFGLLSVKERMAITAAEVSYTACTAPTEIALSQVVQLPEQQVQLSWSGATAGTNVEINSYEIYRSITRDGDYELLGSTTDASTSYTVNAPEDAGDYYYYKVKTLASINGTLSPSWDSGLSESYAELKASTQPGAPTITDSTTVVPSYGGNATFKVEPGVSVDGLTTSLAYSTSATGTKVAFISPLILPVSSTSTYYFFTYDGLQYSNATTKTVTVNTKPSINNVTYEGLTTYSALGGTGTIGSYQLKYASAIQPKITTNKIGKVTVELEYYSSNDTNAWNSSSSIRVPIISDFNITSTMVILENSNIHRFIEMGSTNIHWRLRLVLNDEIENSDFVYFPADNQYYAIARASSIENVYNQFSDSNISGTQDKEIWQKVRLKIYDDTSVSVTNVSASADGSALDASFTTSKPSESSPYRYINITLPDGIAGGSAINIIVNLEDSNGYITKTINAEGIKETKAPTLVALDHGADIIKPFTDSGPEAEDSFEISTNWPFRDCTTLDATTLAKYNCSTNASDAIKIVYSSDNSDAGTNKVTKTLAWQKVNDSIVTSMNKNAAYDWTTPHSLGYEKYAGIQIYYCRLEITNLFGKVFSTPWVERKFNFMEPAQSPTISDIDYSTDGGATWESLGNKAIQEGVYLRFNCSFGLYTTDEVKVAILLKNSSGERSISCYESGSPTRITPIIYSSTELTRATNRTVATNTKSYIYQVTTEIADTANRQWRINIQNSGYDVYSSYKTTPVVRQCAPTLTFTQCEANASYQLTYAYTLTDNGGGTLTNYLSDGTQDLTTALSSASGTVQSLVTGWETKSVSVKTVSVVTGLYTNTKTYYSNAILVYRLSPTVAYRKNSLGINVDTPDSEAIVDIHQSTGKEFIYIQGTLSDSNPPIPTRFKIDVSTGAIEFSVFNSTEEEYEVKNIINLANGILE